MFNTKLVRHFGTILRLMLASGKQYHAPVLNVHHDTRKDPFKILVFTMLSARTRDEATLKVVNRLFQVADNPKAIVLLGEMKLRKILYGVGFYKTKTKNLIRTCQLLLTNDSNVPNTLEGLLAFPGVGRKTANIVLARAFGKDALGVDIHVHRISNRLGLVRTKRPEDTEFQLVKVIPKKYLKDLNFCFVAFGQTVCMPRSPHCSECPIYNVCWRIGVKKSS